MATLAEEIAVEMEFHAALGTTTRAKIEAIEKLVAPLRTRAEWADQILAKLLDYADSDYVPNALFDRARAHLGTPQTS